MYIIIEIGKQLNDKTHLPFFWLTPVPSLHLSFKGERYI